MLSPNYSIPYDNNHNNNNSYNNNTTTTSTTNTTYNNDNNNATHGMIFSSSNRPMRNSEIESVPTHNGLIIKGGSRFAICQGGFGSLFVCHCLPQSLDHVFATDLLQLPQMSLVSLYPWRADCVKFFPVTVCLPCVQCKHCQEKFLEHNGF